jgi:amphi-Trp domain-containing protein
LASKIPARFQGRARRDAAAFYLAELAKGLLSGELGIVRGDQGTTTLATTEFLLLEIEVKQKKRVNHVGVKLRWPRRPLIRVATSKEADGG